MKPVSPEDSAQAMQRVRVGLTGLAMVLVLIGLASAIFTSVRRDQPITAIGASNAQVVANMADVNTTEPATPSTSATEAVNAAEIARRQRAAQAPK